MAAVPPAALQLQPDGAAGGMFAGVVEQDLHELAELPLVAAYRQLRLHLRLERQPALIERGLKLAAPRSRRSSAEADGGKRGLRPGVFRPRQLQQPLDQRAHLLRHGADAVGELLLLRLVVVRALQQLGVGEDDGQRGLELVRGVGDELLLLPPGISTGRTAQRASKIASPISASRLRRRSAGCCGRAPAASAARWKISAKITLPSTRQKRRW